MSSESEETSVSATERLGIGGAPLRSTFVNDAVDAIRGMPPDRHRVGAPLVAGRRPAL
jgi:hypothetical protein